MLQVLLMQPLLAQASSLGTPTMGSRWRYSLTHGGLPSGDMSDAAPTNLPASSLSFPVDTDDLPSVSLAWVAWHGRHNPQVRLHSHSALQMPKAFVPA